MKVKIVGTGLVASRVARLLSAAGRVDHVLLAARDPARARSTAASVGPAVQAVPLDTPADVTVITTSSGSHVRLADTFVAAGESVVSVSDSVADVEGLLGLHDRAVQQGVLLVIGAAMAPGLSDVFAVHAAESFDRVQEVHVAKFGTGGPACARQHHSALGSSALEWYRGWRVRPGGSGRELCWFPNPVDAADCYLAGLADPLLLHRYFADAERITARVAASRRDRFTARLPMFWPPHPEGLLGAIRVELRGAQGAARAGRILGASAPAAVGAAVAAAGAAECVGARRGAATSAATDPVPTNPASPDAGALGLGELVQPQAFIAEAAARGVVCEVFAGGSLSAE